MQSQCELKAAGLPYPRTCPVCRLGPCAKQDSMIFANAEITFEGTRNGMNQADPHGSYLALSVKPDNGGPVLNVKISRTQAEALGKDLLRNS